MCLKSSQVLNNPWDYSHDPGLSLVYSFLRGNSFTAYCTWCLFFLIPSAPFGPDWNITTWNWNLFTFYGNYRSEMVSKTHWNNSNNLQGRWTWNMMDLYENFPTDLWDPDFSSWATLRLWFYMKHLIEWIAKKYIDLCVFRLYFYVPLIIYIVPSL